jgi:hypothetical protein
MLDALLEMIGTLGVLANLAAKFGKLPTNAMACSTCQRRHIKALTIVDGFTKEASDLIRSSPKFTGRH